MSKLIPLQMWAERWYSPVPSSKTLIRWIPHIVPRPEKHGRQYRVPENARYIDPTSPNYSEDYERARRESSSQ